MAVPSAAKAPVAGSMMPTLILSVDWACPGGAANFVTAAATAMAMFFRLMGGLLRSAVG